MQRKPLFWFLISAVCLAGAIYFWRLGDQWQAQQNAAPKSTSQAPGKSVVAASSKTNAAANAPVVIAADKSVAAKKSKGTNAFPYRLTNTKQSVKDLVHNDRAILLMNALLDTGKPMKLAIPDSLRAKGDGGSYVVQANGPLDDQFRAALSSANATIVSYIPNNAYLVRVSAGGAQQLAGNPQTQSVLPFEPYYKLDPSLLQMAVEQPKALPPNGLTLTVFPDAYDATKAALDQLNAQVLSEGNSPFGPVLQVRAIPGTLTALANLPGVQGIAPTHRRVTANDISRVLLGGSADTVVASNYLGLSGSNILININDTGVDQSHPDFGTGRLSSDFPFALVDNNGHGTHVAGTILGSGSQSATVTAAQGSVSNANFRGLAFNATAFVMDIDASSDSYLQETAARTNAFISNNSWNYGDSSGYDIEAASYDAAVRDALPEVTGSQPLLYVFSAGNAGSGSQNGTGGAADSILSPATAKDVITVGASEQPRFIEVLTTNRVDGTNQVSTNSIFLNETDSGNQVADFSSRGNVGVNVEGGAGRFKPDVVAPGTFVISDRSTTWDTAAYYNPTNFNSSSGSDVLATNVINPETAVIGIPANVIGITFSISTNKFSPNPMPPLPIYIGINRTPLANAFDFLGTNFVRLPTNGVPLTVGSSLVFSVGNSTNVPVPFDWTLTLISTNDNGSLIALSNANNGLGAYRYESGTSMAAAGVSGMLALMQEFFQSRLQVTNSPALMKAFLINGSRTLGQPYDFSSGAPNGNFQGWGLPSLPNSIPATLTNLNPNNIAASTVIFYDQNPTNALATGQSQKRTLDLSADGQQQDMHITLVWTDPPGNPSAGTKLVNDLDLIVSNTVTGETFFGNDFPGNSIYTQSWDPSGPANIDSVNNVENVYLQGPLDSRYTITVLGRRVNVNAVTSNTNNIVQDYALVISSGDAGGAVTPFASLKEDAIVTITNAVTNVFTVSNAVPLFNQRVGANSQYSLTTNGLSGQWNFYVYTNTGSNANFTNVAIVTFTSPNLGVVRMGASTENATPANGLNADATRSQGADIDLYVSADSTLLNLNPVAVANASKSTGRTGSETVLLTNSFVGQVLYIAVKAEDQEAAQFDLFSVATSTPFNQTDANGNPIVTIITPFPVIIPGGSPTSPNHGLILGVTTSSAAIRKVTVTNTVAFPEFGDLIGTLTHSQKTAVLNNHSFFTNLNDTVETFVYDDSGENIPGTRTSDPPGSLQNFVGGSAGDGVWMFTMVNDSSLSDTGEIDNFSISIEPQTNSNGGVFSRAINADSWFYDFVVVPPDATNLTITVTGNIDPVDLVIKQGSFPTLSSFDQMAVIFPFAGSLSVNKFQSPPLNAGVYFFGIFNPSPRQQNVFITVQVDESLTPITPLNFLSPGNEPILDDAVTFSTNTVGENSTVISAEVGVRIDHPRESDLVLTLIDPDGTRVLLSENRGGLDTNGYGTGANFTNFFAPEVAGSNVVNIQDIPVLTTGGALVISYDFFTVPDDLRVYYNSVRIFDSGLISGAGTFTVDFGPGLATNIQIVMNEPGTNPGTNGDQWTYSTAVITRELSYAVFSENTNLTTTPIKFAPPPFGHGPADLPAQILFTNGFEGDAAGDYVNTVLADGWSVTNGRVTVVTVPNLATDGANVLALHNGSITRTFATTPGTQYTLSYAYHGRPILSPSVVSWWKGDSSAPFADSVGGNTLNPIGLNPVFPAPAVDDNGLQFLGNGSGQKLHVPDVANLTLTNALTVEGWVAVEGSGPSTILERGDNTGTNNAYHLGLDGGNNLQWYVTGTNQPTPPIATFGVPSADINPTPVFVHVTGTYNSVTSNLNLYFDGALVNTTTQTNMPLGALNAGALPGVGLGNSGTSDTTNDLSPFNGIIDELTVYGSELTIQQIQDIYAAGSAGKRAPVNDNQPSLASVTVAGLTNQLQVALDQWSTNVISFVATSSNTTLTISAATNANGVDDGILLDSFVLGQSAVANGANYYLPEESLSKLTGARSKGNWVLEVLDNRAGATNPPPTLVSWQLSLVLADTVPLATPLGNGVAQTNTVQPGSIVYFVVNVPPWASFATNLLTNFGPGGPLNLLFNQIIEPTGTNINDFFLTQPTDVLSTDTNTSPVLLPGRTYFLGVQNTDTNNAASFTLEVNFDITTLFNAIPVTNNIAAGNIPQYYQFDVASNQLATVFQISNASGNVELVARRGAPLPDQGSFDYFSATPGANQQTIIVVTNSQPVPLTAGRWFLGVFNTDTNTVGYTIVATEYGLPNVIPLTNGVPFVFQSAPGPALTNFFSFTITNNPDGALFEVYNNSGNVDLTMDSNSFPFAPPFFASSANLGTNREQIVIRTNLAMTNLNTIWYLGVPNNDTNNVTYTIRAVVSTNGLLISGVPIRQTVVYPPPGSPNGPTVTWPSVEGEMYQIQVSTNLVTWVTNATVTAAGINTIYVDPNPPNPNQLGATYYRIVQVP